MVNNNLESFRSNTNKEKFSYTGSGQVTSQRINDISQATKIETVTGETLTLAAGAAGTTGKVSTIYAPITDSLGRKLGYYLTATNTDTSISINHLALAGDEVRFDEYLNDTELYALLSNGDYTVDYTNGIIYYKKETADTAGTIDYKYTSQEIDLSVSSLSIGDVTSNGQNIATETTLGTVNTNLGTIETDIEAINTDTTSIDGKIPTLGTAVMTGSSPVTLATDDTQLGAVGSASVVDGNIHAQLRYIGESVDGLESSVPNINAEYSSPYDFSAEYTSTTSITITGAPFTVDDSSCYIVGIAFKATAGTTWTKIENGHNGVGMVASSGVITVSGYGTPFASGDTYRVAIAYQQKAYDSTTDVLKTINQSPDRASYVLDSLLDTTNIAAATNYYPSSTGMSMDGFKDASLSGKFIDADGTMTMTIEATQDEDSTNADWIQIYANDIKNNSIATSWTVTNGTLTFAIDLDNLNANLFRVKMVNDGATNTGIIKLRRKSL